MFYVKPWKHPVTIHTWVASSQLFTLAALLHRVRLGQGVFTFIKLLDYIQNKGTKEFNTFEELKHWLDSSFSPRSIIHI